MTTPPRTIAIAFAEGLRDLGPLTVLAEPVATRALLLQPPTTDEDTLTVTARRPAAGAELVRNLVAIGPEGETLARQPLRFPAGEVDGEAALALPLDLRNRIARLELQPAEGVGGVVLLDERWRRRAVGLVGLSLDQVSQPLLSELFYVERALEAQAGLREGDVARLLENELSAIVLTDSAQLSLEDRTALTGWIETGGVLLRFAGPRLANADQDELVPVPLRRGDRNLDGTLSWARALPLTSFDDQGPLAELPVPAEEVIVNRQVLAQPGPALANHSWARLSDGTPLITGRRQGEGWLVLIHTTANNSWSSLPISGVFVDLLGKIVALGSGAGGAPDGLLAPIEVLDAAGRLVEPGQTAQPVPGDQLATTPASATNPPGLYGRIEGDEDAPREALNLASAVPDLTALTPDLVGGGWRGYLTAEEVGLMPWLLLAALLIALADTVIGLALRGLLPLYRPAATTAAAVLLALAALLPLWPGPALAQSGLEAGGDEMIVEATGQTHLAYVLTNLPEVDEVSRAGLEGLSLVLNRRTAVETGDPLPVDLELDDLNLFPLLYWPIPGDHPDLSAEIRERIDVYLRQGGMILFDTADAGRMIPGQSGPGAGERRLRQLLAGINLPPLEPVPEDHTLTRSFYLLQDFPGRWTGRDVWVDQPEPSVNDGVSSVIIGSHDWAAAWAVDEFTMPIYPVLPGGEHQREIARRFGVNLVMYALTGNYKTDQVHIPALLERLGQ
jgi:hypothetical protein